ncbi:MAG TPA: acetyl-CoA hydrolase/transferase C-terminal domain-containing protein [Steroidobacteraceae bacterium]|nr:acetyl-CoA hydrolase/transferase C-terminal domain-containing protein [Steroidobacteraceae bacterium]
MATIQSGKRAKLISAREAAELVKSDDWVDYGFALGQPDLFDQALGARASQLQRVKIRGALTVRPRAILDADPGGEHFLWYNWHFSGYDRRQHDAGRCNYIPMNFGEAPDYYRRFVEPIAVACVKTAPIDDNGYFNFGPSTSYHRAMIERAQVVIVETNTNVPRVVGPDTGLHASEVDFVIDGGSAALPELPAGQVSAVERQVARLIAQEIQDGACLQIGIGGMPNAVCSLLREANVRDLGIHTEMMVDGIGELIEMGIVTNRRKQIDTGRSVYSFALGTSKLYRLLDGNPAIWSYSVDYTNLPVNIAQNEHVVSINNTTQIDLQGQAASESSGHRQISGTGGQLQFVRGAYASRGGKSFICLSSTCEVKGQRVSRIVSTLTPGNIVTTPRTDVMYVVTEYGMVNLKGKSVAERAQALISIAHPDYRETLTRAAREQQLIPKGY